MISFARVQANFDVGCLDIRQGILFRVRSAVSKEPALCLVLWVKVPFNRPFTLRVIFDFDGLLPANQFDSDYWARVRIRFDWAFGPVGDIFGVWIAQF